MSLKMPEPDQEVLARRGQIAAALRDLVPDGVIDDVDALKAYESDGLTAYRQPPMLAVLPRTTRQVAAILRWCHEQGVKVVPRGSGTSLSASGRAPPESEVPEPRGTTFTPFAWHQARMAETSAVVRGSTASIGGWR